jgi:hypothetical protein
MPYRVVPKVWLVLEIAVSPVLPPALFSFGFRFYQPPQAEVTKQRYSKLSLQEAGQRP